MRVDGGGGGGRGDVRPGGGGGTAVVPVSRAGVGGPVLGGEGGGEGLDQGEGEEGLGGTDEGEGEEETTVGVGVVDPGGALAEGVAEDGDGLGEEAYPERGVGGGGGHFQWGSVVRAGLIGSSRGTVGL